MVIETVPLSGPVTNSVIATLPAGSIPGPFASDGTYLYYSYALPTNPPGRLQTTINYVAAPGSNPPRGTSGTLWQSAPYTGAFDNTVSALAAANGFVVWNDVDPESQTPVPHIWAVRFLP